MNIKGNLFNSFAGATGTVLTALFGGWDHSIKILAILIITDYITGMMKGLKNQSLASNVGYKGAIKKAAIFIVILLAHQMDLISNMDNPVFRTMAIYFYTANEGISIIENLALMGVEIPKGILKYLQYLKASNNDYIDGNKQEETN